MQKELLTFQLKTVRGWIKYHLEDTDDDLMDIVPAGFNNNLHWQFGHVIANMESELVSCLVNDDVENVSKSISVQAQARMTSMMKHRQRMKSKHSLTSGRKNTAA